MNSILLIVSGPAGSGKNTVCERLIAENSNILRAVTSTTRKPRAGERDGVDYHFLSVEEFEKSIEKGEFYEWAKVHGNYYGTEKSEILSKLSSGSDVILIIDVQGASTWKKLADSDPELRGILHSVFIKPASLEVIARRMALRGDNPEDIARRLETAKRELEEEKNFELSFLSGTREQDFESLKRIYLSFKK